MLEGVHGHIKHVKIEDMLKAGDKQWSDMKEVYSRLVQVATLRYEALKPIILHFDGEGQARKIQVVGGVRNIVKDFKALQASNELYIRTSETIEKFIDNCDLL